MFRIYLIIVLMLTSVIPVKASVGSWKITHYCSCKKCCGKWSDGHFASGKEVYQGGVACNWLPFGTKVIIDNIEYTVEDRGAKSLFGDKNNKIKHIDIWTASHKQALKLGVVYKKVRVVK